MEQNIRMNNRMISQEYKELRRSLYYHLLIFGITSVLNIIFMIKIYFIFKVYKAFFYIGGIIFYLYFLFQFIQSYYYVKNFYSLIKLKN